MLSRKLHGLSRKYNHSRISTDSNRPILKVVKWLLWFNKYVTNPKLNNNDNTNSIIKEEFLSRIQERNDTRCKGLWKYRLDIYLSAKNVVQGHIS